MDRLLKEAELMRARVDSFIAVRCIAMFGWFP